MKYGTEKHYNSKHYCCLPRLPSKRQHTLISKQTSGVSNVDRTSLYTHV